MEDERDNPSGVPLKTDALAMSPVLLRFASPVRLRFERDTRQDRCGHLRRSILTGLLFYNAFNLSDFVLVRDMAPYAVAARLLLITPIALALIWAVPRMEAQHRENALLGAMVAVIAVPAAVFGISRSPQVGLTFTEVPLVLVYGCMMLVLDVSRAFLFTLVGAAFTVIAIVNQPAFAHPLGYAMVLQLASACAFVTYGNREIEVVRRRAYLETLRESLRCELLEDDKKELTARSETDPLTGLANRRALRDALATCGDPRVETALLMFDIDYFKPFNDAYGHPAGDACLHDVAKAVASMMRPGALVARYGGEEFAVLLRGVGADRAGLDDLARRLLDVVRLLPIRHGSRPDGKTTLSISVGGAVFSPSLTNVLDLVEAADGALYSAKRSGRDRYCFHDVEGLKAA